MRIFRALIVDDERPAREKIRTMLRSDNEIEVVGECANGAEAITAIEREKPDIVLLDIQMPGIDGFEVLREVGIERVGAVIFVTAYDEYAVRAFEVHALDYLMKPFDDKRFKQSIQRAKEYLSEHQPEEVNRQLLLLLNSLNRRNRHLDRILVRSSGRAIFLRVSEIDWIEAAGNYVNLHVGKASYLLHETMTRLEVRLAPEQFIRIHRSSIVNVERVKELRALSSGDYTVTMSDGTTLPMSRSYRHKLKKISHIEV